MNLLLSLALLGCPDLASPYQAPISRCLNSGFDLQTIWMDYYYPRIGDPITQRKVSHRYGWGMDPLGGGVTYETPHHTWEYHEPVYDHYYEIHARQRHYHERPGYFGGEANYSGVFDDPQ